MYPTAALCGVGGWTVIFGGFAGSYAPPPVVIPVIESCSLEIVTVPFAVRSILYVCMNLPLPPGTINLVLPGFVNESSGLVSFDDVFRVPFRVKLSRFQLDPNPIK